jgi:tetratricopeptide (TPR) repeat protein
LPRYNYALALFLNEQYKEAADQLRPVLARNQRDGESFYLLSKALLKTDDATAAADFDNQARRFLPNYAKLETEWQKSNQLDALGLRVEQPLRRDFVSVVLTKRGETTPVQTAVNETEKLMNEAKALYKAGSDDEAMQVLRRILASEPMSAEAYLLLGNIHLRHGDLDQSISSLKTALFWDNRLIDGHIALGKIYLERKDCPQAQNYSASALSLDENNEQALALKRSVERCSK